MAQNFINARGRDQFVRLLNLFKENAPLAYISKEYSVTRQRAFQWRHAFGQTRVMYLVDPEIDKLLGGTGRTQI